MRLVVVVPKHVRVRNECAIDGGRLSLLILSLSDLILGLHACTTLIVHILLLLLNSIRVDGIFCTFRNCSRAKKKKNATIRHNAVVSYVFAKVTRTPKYDKYITYHSMHMFAKTPLNDSYASSH